MQKNKKLLNNWHTVKLSKAIRIIGGGTPKTSVPEYWNGNISWLSPPDFNNCNRYVEKTKRNITRLGLDNSTTQLLQPGDLILSARGTVGALAQLRKPMAFSQTSYGLRKKLASISNDFLFYIIKYNIKRFKKLSYGAVFDTITTKTFDEIKISFPPLPEQKKIVSILSTWDQAIENMDRLVLAKEKQFKWLLKKLISDQNNNPQWKKVKLEKVVRIKKGQQLNRITLDKNGEYPVQNGGVDPSGYTDKWNVKENTITISEGGNSCGFVKFNEKNFWSGGHCYSLVDLSNELEKRFLFHYLKNNEQKIMRLRVGSGLPNIQKKDIECFPIMYPNLITQKKAVNVLDSKEQEINLLKQISKRYQNQKKYLMQQLLTGRTRL